MDCFEKEVGHNKLAGDVISELTALKRDYLVKLDLSVIKHQQLPVIMQLVIDTWNDFANHGWIGGFTKDAALILGNAMHGLKFHHQEEASEDFLKSIATILLKKIYGEEYGLRLSFDLTFEQVMLLNAFQAFSSPPVSIQDLNRALGSEGLCFKHAPIVSMPAPAPAQLTFTNALSSENREKRAAEEDLGGDERRPRF